MNLFIITSPYQYLIARGLKEHLNDSSDLIILNHYEGAKELYFDLKNKEIWNDVYFFDDTFIRKEYKNGSLRKKLLMFKNCQKILPNLKYEKYNNLFIAHDTVLFEYSVAKKFYQLSKKVFLIEDGYGNYVNLNKNKNFIIANLKKLMSLLDMPGNYLGQVRYISEILVQFPEQIYKQKFPIGKKVNELPFVLKDILIKLKDELLSTFKVSQITLPKDSVLILTEPINDENFKKSVYQIYNKFNNKSVILKPHPRDTLDYSNINGIKILSNRFPVELIPLLLGDNNNQLKIVSWGSTATLNLYLILKNKADIIFINDSNFYEKGKYNIKDINTTLKKVFKLFNIKYKYIKI